MKTHIYALVTTLLLLLQLPAALAQNKIQVVTKTIERKLDYYRGTQLRITSEKASIKITGWDKNYIGLTLKLISKHPDRAIAEKELEHLRYIIEEKDLVQNVGNYFNVSKTSGPIKANLKAEYVLMVPENCPLIITAKYGEASIIGMSGRSEITLEYSKLNLQNVSGDMVLTSNLGDISGTNLNLDLTCEAQKADIELANAGGSYKIENTYGHVRIKPNEQLKKLTVNGNRTEVKVWVKNFDNYNYDLSTTHSDIDLPDAKNAKVASSQAGKRAFQLTTNKKKPTIKVSSTNSPVSIGLQ